MHKKYIIIINSPSKICLVCPSRKIIMDTAV